MSFLKNIILLFVISSSFSYTCDNKYSLMNGPSMIDRLYSEYNDISPNILNLCNDLHYQNYKFNIISNHNLGIYKNNNKLIEIPINCQQPGINNCIQWSGIQFASNPTKQDMIVELYFNILGFQNRPYNNIFKTNNKYKNIKLTNVRHSYPLFKIDGINYFTNIIRDSIRNVIYTDPGKLLMYRLFLASTEKQNNPSMEYIKSKLTEKIDSRNGLMEYNFPIIINQSYDGAIHSMKNSRIGISLDQVNLFALISLNDKSANFGALARPVETSLYHEFVHCFKQLLFTQSVKLNMSIINPFKYKVRASAAVQQVFHLFSEYNNVKEPMDKQTIYDIFCSTLLYRDGLDAITSNEEFTTMIGIYPGSKYYYPGAELSENLFRYYTRIPIRDTHLSAAELSSPYFQSSLFVKNVQNNIANLDLNYSKINFHLPTKNSGTVQNMTHDNIINFYDNQIKNINNLKFCNNNNIKEIVTGYNGCNYKLFDSSLLCGIFGMLDRIRFTSKQRLSLYDVDKKIEEIY